MYHLLTQSNQADRGSYFSGYMMKGVGYVVSVRKDSATSAGPFVPQRAMLASSLLDLLKSRIYVAVF